MENKSTVAKDAFPWNISPRNLPRICLWTVSIILALASLLFIASFFLDGPIRGYMENRLNRDLKGYYVRLPAAHFQLVNLSLTLKGLTIIQQAHPDPPVAVFPELYAGIHWRALLSRRLVGEFSLDRPKVKINLLQLRSEAASKVPIQNKGWQQAVEDICPLKINLLTINDGELTYVDQDPKRPLHLDHLNLEASNIRNVDLPDKVYPSSFNLKTDIFGTGRGAVSGKANFLEVPYPGIKGSFKLENIPLGFFAPVIARSNLTIHNGLFAAAGTVEYAPRTKTAVISNMTVSGMDLEYRHTKKTATAEKRRVEKVGKAAAELGKSTMLVRIERLRLTGCNVGMANEAASHPYRVFMEDADLSLGNLSNRVSPQPAELEVRGRFMGSGATRMTARYLREKSGPDLDLHVRIENTQLTDMNDLFRAYDNVEVKEGQFSLYSDLHIRHGTISGYLKPFFKNVKVYDARTEREKGLVHQLHEIMVGGIAKLLESQATGAVATKVDISGKLEKPETSTWQIIGRLIKNAFFKAILPGFENEFTHQGKK